MRTEPVPVPLTARLAREAERWRGAARPAHVVRPGPGQRSVWDFPRPPAVERVLERVTVEHGGVVVADAPACLRVLETASPPTYYLAVRDVRMDLVRPGVGSSRCEWKGVASYLDVVADAVVAAGAAWWYREPAGEYAVLRDHVAFYASRVDRCTVAGEVVAPQPGRYYGGWVTRDLTGPWKGEPGSQGW